MGKALSNAFGSLGDCGYFCFKHVAFTSHSILQYAINSSRQLPHKSGVAVEGFRGKSFITGKLGF
jgi:hypothetical protein